MEKNKTYITLNSVYKVCHVYDKYVQTLEGRSEDFGLFTPIMKEKDFSEKWEALGDKVLSRIRLS